MFVYLVIVHIIRDLVSTVFGAFCRAAIRVRYVTMEVRLDTESSARSTH